MAQKTGVHYEHVESIPYWMREAFHYDYAYNEEVIHDIEKDPYKLGIFIGDEMIGFTSGHYFDNRLFMSGVWVSREHRKRGIAKGSLCKAIFEARRMGLRGVDLTYMADITALMIMGMEDKLKDHPWLSVKYRADEDYGHCGEIVFKDDPRNKGQF